MRPKESFIGQSVRSLQTMLRVIAESDESQPSVIPDGIYGQDTVNAVTSFQRRNGLSPTGITDQETWDAIVPIYQQSLIQVDQAHPLQVILNPNDVIRQGAQHPNVYIAQGILTVLSQAYGSIPLPGFSGVIDIPTSASLSAFQLLSLLPDTGELDKVTWKHLTLHYPMAAKLSTPKK